MTILYDDRAFRQRFGGVPKSFCEVLRRLPDGTRWRVAAHAVENEFLHAKPFGVPAWPAMFMDQWRGVGWRYKDWRHRMNDRLFARMVQAKDVDLVHLTEPHAYGGTWKSIPGRVPVVVTIHDLIPELIRHDADVRRERAEVLRRASKVIAVSHYTKDRLQELYGTPDEKIAVVSHGPTPAGDVPRAPRLPRNYLLFVGGRYEYKNFPWMLRALAPLLKADGDLKLVCTGLPFTRDERKFLDELAVANRVWQKPIPDSQMSSLFAKARCLICPSRMEGFGIPILDAFAARCPVILSNGSCFPEVGGPAALYFEEGDAQGLRNQVVRLLSDAALRERQIDAGLDRVRRFSWERTAAGVLSVYREVLGTCA